MPHVILEIPRPLTAGKDLQKLLHGIHDAIASVPSAFLADIKTRIHLLDDFRVGAGTSESGSFIHARLIQTRPRSPEDQKLMGEKVMAALEAFFGKDKPAYPLQLCLETTIIPVGGYLRVII
ncbi:5-carboxymethyl-2-hydroxymuconate isomerase [Legionella lansingensis]|uniref:5-carboxymethyl-2-hydroxymuconate isomerase n=1 Tax=Legionella lansingensis TaxID=45067 RepID=A0A0W0VFZ0_9GAMM|nr:hypothetical protein [Legionella lansingensis]KTD18569.1 5-carboxymethyl-2-hydroxymuconate isomerase [Legionella lansingensis]SNV49375.1 5-carboxymethyl-2-hydroxymuconate isomerase [Legionella lansingensis]